MTIKNVTVAGTGVLGSQIAFQSRLKVLTSPFMTLMLLF